MPRTLELTHDKSTFEVTLNKVDRSELYGSVRVVTKNTDDQRCTLATLASDGKTLIPRGGTALAYINTEGQWIARDELQPISLAGDPLEEVPSSFDAPVKLTDTVGSETLLDHSVRLTYLLESEQPWPPAFIKQLKKGVLYRFGFSYRGGVELDPAFVLSDEHDNVWMLVTSANDIDYVSLEQAALCGQSTDVDEVEGDDDEDELDFGML